MAEQLTVPEVQKEAERLLKILDNFCEKNGLRYFAAYGTLLGAVRHEGPIPWDDDVDILMPRPDYEKLISLYPEIGPEDTKLFKPGAPGTPINFVKFVSTRTKMVEEGVHFPEDHGVFVDVFPLDGLPSFLPGFHLRSIDLLHRIFQASYHHKLPDVSPLPFHEKVRKTIGFFGRILPRSAYLKMMNRAMLRYPYDKADRVAMLLSFLPISTEAFTKEELIGHSELPFGEMTVKAFANPVPVLERNYGTNWRTPIKREEASHGVATWR